MESWWSLSHLFVTVFLSYFAQLMVNPAMTDVTLEAVCPGQDECSLAIYLTGFQQAITGVGSMFMMPLIGNLSDVYGRKALLTVPLILSIIPLVILAWKRSMYFFYAYYVFRTLTAMVTQGGVVCIALSYLADTVSEGERTSTFGVLSGVISAALLGSTIAARILPIAQIFQVAAAIAIFNAVYMRTFLKDTTRHIDALKQPILNPSEDCNEASCESSKKIALTKHVPSPKNIAGMLKSSATFSLVASVAFFIGLAEAGGDSFLLYFLKARFGFNKNQFADVLLISYIGATIANLLFMPLLGPIIGEKMLLSSGIFAGFLNMFLDSIAWSAWVPYASAALGIFVFLATPNLRSITSKEVSENEQGIAQGCLLGVTSFASIMSPLIYSPLSALFMSDSSPVHFKGLSIMCVGLAWLIGFILSLFIKPSSKDKVESVLA